MRFGMEKYYQKNIKSKKIRRRRCRRFVAKSRELIFLIFFKKKRKKGQKFPKKVAFPLTHTKTTTQHI